MLNGTRTPSRRGIRALAASIVAVALITGTAGCTSTPAPAVTAAASATPTPAPTGPVATDIAQGDQTDAVDVDVQGPVQVNFREITLPPGTGTGKHCHYGELIAVVKQGVLTHYSPTHPGGVATYSAGQSVIEGPGYVHEGKNEGTENVVLWVTYVTPEGKPLAETDLSKCTG